MINVHGVSAQLLHMHARRPIVRERVHVQIANLYLDLNLPLINVDYCVESSPIEGQ